MQQRQVKQNGDGSTIDQPRDSLDMTAKVLEGPKANALLEETNLGLGNYDEDYLWQQIRSFRKGLFASIAFSGYLWRTARRQTLMALGRDGFEYFDEERGQRIRFEPAREQYDDFESQRETQSSWQIELERGEEIWEQLGNWREPLSEKQLAAVLKKTDYDGDWLPIYWQMVSGRHEASRSKDAELIRDVLTSINEVRGQEARGSGDGLLGGSA